MGPGDGIIDAQKDQRQNKQNGPNAVDDLTVTRLNGTANGDHSTDEWPFHGQCQNQVQADQTVNDRSRSDVDAMPQGESDGNKTFNQIQKVIQNKTIVRYSQKEGDEQMAKDFIRTKTKIENNHSNG